jgi:hypothetical protein
MKSTSLRFERPMLRAPLGLLPGASVGPTALAQRAAADEIAGDPVGAPQAPKTLEVSFAKDVQRMLDAKALVVGSSSDPDLVARRPALPAAGGSVGMRFAALRARSVLLRAAEVAGLAARADGEKAIANDLEVLDDDGHGQASAAAAGSDGDALAMTLGRR